ncbi:AbrB family transcriptional regulator [Evansella cellulosilytica]|uniref:Membrane protein AbrB duplication n=1 Tax=Evansella cellulosilytica (strain ATCC 21833 / DSM 2522 / FERM P-1141 / JCM 9156 / N-4) TaxID=649639 RepID=E6U0D5_EVAC2|nr:AbrB family transcriptional regulator [Evansella cellulosilytica]ADU30251.1 membrane protein AbrB duplication [Evansella cellulosilytica DSM 2522]
MKNIHLKVILETFLVGLLGGLLFFVLDLPLPWVLGAMAFIMLWQGFSKRTILWPSPIKNSGLLILGTFFGLYFTNETFITVGPYILPYILLTIILIFISIFNSALLAKWIKVDRITSILGSIPGGLTEMVTASESLHARPSLVAIFQTVRLLTVLFVVPFVTIHLFTASDVESSFALENEGNEMISLSWGYLLYVIPIVAGITLRNVMPAGIIIFPLAITALLNISSLELLPLPSIILIIAQIFVGIGIGKNIHFKDLKIGGKYCFAYFGLALALIAISFGLGVILAALTSLSLSTAMLSIAPGGLIEMVLTAAAIGADPAIVSALQFIRILIIIIFVPPLIKWFFEMKKKKEKVKKAA